MQGGISAVNYNDVIMGAMASQNTSLTIVYSTIYSGTDQRKQQSSASLAFVRGIHRWPVNSPDKLPVTRKMFPFDDVIMLCFTKELIMMTSSNGNIFRVTGHLCGEFTGPRWIPTQRPVTRRFDVFFDLRLNKRLSKQSWGWWFETLTRPLRRHRNVRIYWVDFATALPIVTSSLAIDILDALTLQRLTIVTSHECNGVSNHRQLGYLFYSFFGGNNESNIKAPH